MQNESAGSGFLPVRLEYGVAGLEGNDQQEISMSKIRKIWRRTSTRERGAYQHEENGVSDTPLLQKRVETMSRARHERFGHILYSLARESCYLNLSNKSAVQIS
jgi:hypothetical protein